VDFGISTRLAARVTLSSASTEGGQMNRKLFAAVAAGLLALGAGVALAATQTSAVTSACVNDTNGLMRAADACREGEHRVPIGEEERAAPP
jgi:hypothetical protein